MSKIKMRELNKLSEVIAEAKKRTVEPTPPVVSPLPHIDTEQMTHEIEEITPQKAAYYLTKRSGQRPCSERHVNYLTRIMAEGRFFDMTGEAIQFDFHGNLINGQHRLSALVNAGKTYRFLVVRGLNPEAYRSIDQAKKRSGGDTLSVLGVPHANEAAHAIRLIFQIRDGVLGSKGGGKKATMHDNGAIGDFASQHFSHTCWMASLCNGAAEVTSPGYLGAVMFLGGIGKPDRAEEFVHRIKTGTEQHMDDPDYILRQKLLRLRDMARSDRQNPRKTVSASEGIPWIIAGWNAFAKYRKLRKINPVQNIGDIDGAPQNWEETLFNKFTLIKRVSS